MYDARKPRAKLFQRSLVPCPLVDDVKGGEDLGDGSKGEEGDEETQRKQDTKSKSRILKGRDMVTIPHSASLFNMGGKKRRYEALNTSASIIHTNPVRCHHCLAPGHMHKYCPLRYCRLCDMYTHTAKQCFRTHVASEPHCRSGRGGFKKRSLVSRSHNTFKWRSSRDEMPVPFGTAGL